MAKKKKKKKVATKKPAHKKVAPKKATPKKTAAKKAAPKKVTVKKSAPKKETGFWSLIDAHRKGADYDLKGLTKALAARSKEDILGFDDWLGDRLDESYRGDLWGAAFLTNGGCSDDGFDYFRGWLISRGQKVFEAAVADPDSIVSVVGDGEVELESILYVPARAWQQKTGKDDYYEQTEKDDDAKDDAEDDDDEDLDFSWSENGDMIPERMEKAYPKLFKKFG